MTNNDNNEENIEDKEHINLADWYNAKAAAAKLSKNSGGRPVQISYPRKLAQYNKVRTLKVSDRVMLYNKVDIDNYKIEDRGVKSGEAKRRRYGKTGETVREQRKAMKGKEE